MLKIGLDIHGVIDTYPYYFKKLSEFYISCDFEVHIITGAQKTKELTNLLNNFEIQYTHFFSISDYLIKNGFKHHFSSSNNPWFDEEVWICQKGDYAKRVNLNIHYDDTLEYKSFFPKCTMFCLIKIIFLNTARN